MLTSLSFSKGSLLNYLLALLVPPPPHTLHILSSNTHWNFTKRALNTQVISAISPADPGPRLHQTASVPQLKPLANLQNARGELTPYFTNAAEA